MNENTINWQEIGEETVTYARDLLRLDTRNPPGHEVRAAEYLQALLALEIREYEVVL